MAVSNSQAHWSQHGATAALVGILVEGTLVALVALSEPPFPAPPPAGVPWLILSCTYAAVCLPLLIWRRAAGYLGAMFAGLFTLLTIAVIFSGAVGPPPMSVIPLGPLTLGALALASIVCAAVAWRVR